MGQFEISLQRQGWRSHDQGNLSVRVLGYPADETALVRAVAADDRQVLADMPGNWAVIAERSSSVTLIQDNLRSFPLFYSTTAPIHVSDDVERLRSLVDDGGVDEASATEFRFQAFVTGADTLFSAIRQVQAGEQIVLSADARAEATQLRRMRYSGLDLRDEAELDENFTRAFDTALDRVFARIGTRQVAIPLSGGLDSRLLAVAMRDRGIKNVVTFTYGVGRTREVEISREVAERLGLAWEFISYSPEELAHAWSQPDTAAFIAAGYSGSALPHIQDWFALRTMRAAGTLDEDAVIFPGHCVVGAMHDESIMSETEPPSAERMKRLIFGHHAAIHSGAETLWDQPRYQRKLDRFVADEGYDGSVVSRLALLENYNMAERQAKYINNSVRSYEHFGYDWALPLLDIDMFDAWQNLAPEVAMDRAWFRRYVGRRYAAASGTEIGEFTATNVSAGKREAVKRILRAVGLLTPVERRITLRAVESHPMGFQAFLGTATPKDLRREILRGGTQMGVFTDQFLAGTWAPGADLLSRTPRPNSL